MSRTEIELAAEQTVQRIGARIKDLRTKRKLTLQVLAEKSGLSASMLSMMERGQASPSLMSLTTLAHCLGVQIGDLIIESPSTEMSVVSRFQDAAPLYTPDHVLRRILREDDARQVKLTWNVYGPGIGNNPAGIEHSGYEYGLCLEGQLTVEIEGTPHVLGPGDLVFFSSRKRHKLWNYGDVDAVAVWFNLFGDEG